METTNEVLWAQTGLILGQTATGVLGPFAITEVQGTWLAEKIIYIPTTTTAININLQANNLATLYIDYALIGTGSFESPGVFTDYVITSGFHTFTIQVDHYGGIPSQLYFQVTDYQTGALIEQAQGNGSWLTSGYVDSPYIVTYDGNWSSSTYVPRTYWYAIPNAFANANVEFELTSTGTPDIGELRGLGISPWKWNLGGKYT